MSQYGTFPIAEPREEKSGLPTWVKFVIGFLVFLILLFVGLFTWKAIESSQGQAPADTKEPPNLKVVETPEQKAAREAKEAADKAASLTTAETAKEQAALDADVKAAANRITNMPYEVEQTKAALVTYNAATDKKAALVTFATQRERALASAGWGSNLASAIETRAKVLKKETDDVVSKAIADLRSGSDAAFAALTGADTGTELFKDANGCVGHMTKDLGIINCPPKFNTFYSYGVNVAADCPDKDGLCNRCTGFSFPSQRGGREGGWNNSQWAVQTGKATATAKRGEGKLMSYSGIYVVDGQPQAYEPCQ